ncbi:hypothetical protein ETD83_38255 [Actinomadura soli]|uniref:Integrase n=1 Tax=Actinomadura soli TaxID=2508997 RepID=A0A5C4J2X5_9ACTN|nr:hypothetical protein [Actinomadura soli]TMQ89803.1 hypothetical protein ETD83_38255 [Actinomadura soli]
MAQGAAERSRPATGAHHRGSRRPDADLAVKAASDQLGHSNTRITEDLYTQVREAVQDEAPQHILTPPPELAAKKKRKTRS